MDDDGFLDLGDIAAAVPVVPVRMPAVSYSVTQGSGGPPAGGDDGTEACRFDDDGFLELDGPWVAPGAVSYQRIQHSKPGEGALAAIRAALAAASAAAAPDAGDGEGVDDLLAFFSADGDGGGAAEPRDLLSLFDEAVGADDDNAGDITQQVDGLALGGGCSGDDRSYNVAVFSTLSEYAVDAVTTATPAAASVYLASSSSSSVSSSSSLLLASSSGGSSALLSTSQFADGLRRLMDPVSGDVGVGAGASSAASAPPGVAATDGPGGDGIFVAAPVVPASPSPVVASISPAASSPSTSAVVVSPESNPCDRHVGVLVGDADGDIDPTSRRSHIPESASAGRTGVCRAG